MIKLRLILVVIMVFAITIAVALPTYTIGDPDDARNTIICKGKDRRRKLCPILIGTDGGYGNTNNGKSPSEDLVE
ncbi:11371_t:CDS:2 [Paraglomus brasilianum]|uniref:11371_t:CDS:1 n=1 Tax=Paraglomus brasilianum TaxID=144538 RepID=A0A9N9GZT6_9GLOM|nr:11371_t:CDS:2 [Paraglomus brasilianum]